MEERQNKQFHRRGAAIMRGDMVPSETLDAELLRSKNDQEWTDLDPWRVLRIGAEFVEGFGSLADLPPAISVFGSARVNPGDPYYEIAVQVGQRFAQAGYAIITGGGPGIMQAANQGAVEQGGSSVGLGIELPHEQSLNPYLTLGINFRYFFVRKTMFVKYSKAFVVMPGGFGTLDELFEAVTLVQTHKILSFPVVLVGSRFWNPLIDWIRETLLSEGMIKQNELELIKVVDTADEAYDWVISHMPK